MCVLVTFRIQKAACKSDQDCKKLAYLAPMNSLWMHKRAFLVTSAFSWFISFITRSFALRSVTINLHAAWYCMNCDRSKYATANDIGSLDVSSILRRPWGLVLVLGFFGGCNFVGIQSYRNFDVKLLFLLGQIKNCNLFLWWLMLWLEQLVVVN